MNALSGMNERAGMIEGVLLLCRICIERPSLSWPHRTFRSAASANQFTIGGIQSISSVGNMSGYACK